MPDHKANYGRQQNGFDLLKAKLSGFYVPQPSEKDLLLELLGISKSFKQTFDAIRLHVPCFSAVQSARDFDLIELKTTDKYLPNLPQGFFFGLTENEEMLLKVFNGKYLLCFVSLHPDSTGYCLRNWNELQELIQTKRVQYQINLRTRRRTESSPIQN